MRGTFVNGDFCLGNDSGDEYVPGDVIYGGISIDTGNTQNGFIGLFGFRYGKKDGLGIVSSCISVDNDIFAVGEAKLP